MKRQIKMQNVECKMKTDVRFSNSAWLATAPLTFAYCILHFQFSILPLAFNDEHTFP